MKLATQKKRAQAMMMEMMMMMIAMIAVMTEYLTINYILGALNLNLLFEKKLVFFN